MAFDLDVWMLHVCFICLTIIVLFLVCIRTHLLDINSQNTCASREITWPNPIHQECYCVDNYKHETIMYPRQSPHELQYVSVRPFHLAIKQTILHLIQILSRFSREGNTNISYTAISGVGEVIDG